MTSKSGRRNLTSPDSFTDLRTYFKSYVEGDYKMKVLRMVLVLFVLVAMTSGCSALGNNAKVTVRNENTNETLTGDTDSNGQRVFNLASFDSGWTVGDIITYFTLYS